MKSILLIVACAACFLFLQPSHAVQIPLDKLRELQNDPRIKSHFEFWNSLDKQPTVEQFKCDTDLFANWSTKAKTVHQLTPVDIGAIAAMGDSLTAGIGIKAKNLLEVLIEFRGQSWRGTAYFKVRSIGGDDSLEAGVFTLPNVLKKYNPKLKGYSVGSNVVLAATESVSHLNVAVSASTSEDLLAQAETLVKRLANEKLTEEWKIITLFIGGNDQCQWCRFKDQLSPTNYGLNIEKALDYLHKNVNKALVNLVLPVDTSIVTHLNPTAACLLLHRVIECPCALKPQTYAKEDEFKEIVVQFRTKILDLIGTGKYDTRDDFTVVIQPFFANQRVPIVDDHADYTYFAPDCFHFSQKAQGDSTQALWNNMLEPAGRKRMSWNLKDTWQCPTLKNPYFYTYKNELKP